MLLFTPANWFCCYCFFGREQSLGGDVIGVWYSSGGSSDANIGAVKGLLNDNPHAGTTTQPPALRAFVSCFLANTSSIIISRLSVAVGEKARVNKKKGY